MPRIHGSLFSPWKPHGLISLGDLLKPWSPPPKKPPEFRASRLFILGPRAGGWPPPRCPGACPDGSPGPSDDSAACKPHGQSYSHLRAELSCRMISGGVVSAWCRRPDGRVLEMPMKSLAAARSYSLQAVISNSPTVFTPLLCAIEPLGALCLTKSAASLARPFIKTIGLAHGQRPHGLRSSWSCGRRGRRGRRWRRATNLSSRLSHQLLQMPANSAIQPRGRGQNSGCCATCMRSPSRTSLNRALS